MINWGIIGCGDVAEVKSGPAFQKAENSVLLAVMRRNTEKAKYFAERHQVPSWYDSVDEVLRRDDINGIYIATPPSYHEEQAIQALTAGKDIYLEKPMAINKAACERIMKVVQESGRKLTVAHYRRQLPAFLKVKELLEKRVIGDIRFAEIKILQPSKSELVAKSDEFWRANPEVSGGGLFHDLAPHQIDLMLQYFGVPAEIYGAARNQSGLYPSDDIVSGEMVFESGVFFKGLWCFNVPKSEAKDQCIIMGEKGKITFSFFGEEVKLCVDAKEVVFSFVNPENIQLPMIQKTVNYFLNQGDNPCSGEEALEVMRIMEIFCNR